MGWHFPINIDFWRRSTRGSDLRIYKAASRTVRFQNLADELRATKLLAGRKRVYKCNHCTVVLKRYLYKTFSSTPLHVFNNSFAIAFPLTPSFLSSHSSRSLRRKIDLSRQKSTILRLLARARSRGPLAARTCLLAIFHRRILSGSAVACAFAGWAGTYEHTNLGQRGPSILRNAMRGITEEHKQSDR